MSTPLTRKKRSGAGTKRKADRTIPQQIGSLYDALTPAERAIARELLDFIDLRPVARKVEVEIPLAGPLRVEIANPGDVIDFG